MEVIIPVKITSSILTSNITVTETPWSAGTYTLGTRRTVGELIYEVIATPSTADSPTGAGEGVNRVPPTWGLVGSINKMAMFDGSIGWGTNGTNGSGAIDIDVDIAVPRYVDTVIVLNTEGRRVRVVVNNGVSDVYDETKELKDLSNLTPSYWAWGFEPILPRSDLIFSNLPMYIAATVSITIEGDGAPTFCGAAVIGRSRTIGETLDEVSGGIEDFSRIDRNIFGDYDQVIKRSFSKKREFNVALPSNSLMAVEQLLAELRAEPVVFIGNTENLWTLVYGIYKSFTPVMKTPEHATIAIEIGGLT